MATELSLLLLSLSLSSLLLNGYIILKESLWLDGLTLAILFSLIFVGKMCVFVSHPMKIVTFLRKNDYPPKRVVDFPLERDTFRNKIKEIVEDFDEKKSQQQR